MKWWLILIILIFVAEVVEAGYTHDYRRDVVRVPHTVIPRHQEAVLNNSLYYHILTVWEGHAVPPSVEKTLRILSDRIFYLDMSRVFRLTKPLIVPIEFDPILPPLRPRF